MLILGSDGKSQWMDQYCAGLTFGNQGSKMLVRFANILINPIDQDGNVLPTKFNKRTNKKRKNVFNNIMESFKTFRPFGGENI